jgi:tetratricopeptide (TPR) repeat protein
MLGEMGEIGVSGLRQRVAELEQQGELPEADAAKLVVASLELASALLAGEGFDEAVGVCERMVELYAGAADPILRQGAAWALSLKAEWSYQQGDRDGALDALAELVERFEHDSDSTVRGVVMKGRVREAKDVSDEGRLAEALTLYDRILKHEPNVSGRDDDVTELQIAAATALAEKARTQRRLGHSGDALATYTEFLRRFPKSFDEEIRAQLCSVLAGKALILFEARRYESVLEPVGQLLDEFPTDFPCDRSAVANAVTARTLSLFALGREEEALASSEEFGARCWKDARPSQRMRALSLAAEIQVSLGNADEGLALYDQALEMSDVVDERDTVALTALQRAQALVDVHRYDDARLALEEIVAQYRDDSDEDIRQTVAEALDALSTLGQS